MIDFVAAWVDIVAGWIDFAAETAALAVDYSWMHFAMDRHHYLFHEFRCCCPPLLGKRPYFHAQGEDHSMEDSCWYF